MIPAPGLARGPLTLGVVGRGEAPADDRRRSESPWAPVLAVAVAAGAAAYVIALVSAVRSDSDLLGGLFVIPVLVVLTVPLVKRVARHQTPGMTALILSGFGLKMVGAVLRHAVAFQVYDGNADSARYHQAGAELARAFRDGNFDLGSASVTSTRFIEVLTGVVYSIAGSNRFGGFLIFSWFGFWGLYLFFRAFQIAVPRGDHVRYAMLVFLLPSLLFWPSSIGKEAWMMLTLGMSAYGAARVLTRMRGGFVITAAGLWGAAQVRPHVALILLAGLALGYLLRRSPAAVGLGPVVKVAGVLVLVLGISLVLGRVEERFNLDDTGSKQVTGVLDYTEKQTTQGGSQFDPPRVRTVADIPVATLTVLFRPFPGEARTAQGVVSAIEGVVLLALCVFALRRLIAVPHEMLRTPYLAVALVFTTSFIYAFSTIGNFGILVRQRVQVYPFLLVLLALPRPTRREEPDARRRAPEPAT